MPWKTHADSQVSGLYSTDSAQMRHNCVLKPSGDIKQTLLQWLCPCPLSTSSCPCLHAALPLRSSKSGVHLRSRKAAVCNLLVSAVVPGMPEGSELLITGSADLSIRVWVVDQGGKGAQPWAHLATLQVRKCVCLLVAVLAQCALIQPDLLQAPRLLSIPAFLAATDAWALVLHLLFLTAYPSSRQPLMG